MRAGTIGLAIFLLVGSVYFAWSVTEIEPQPRVSYSPAVPEPAGEHISAQTPAVISSSETTKQSELASRLRSTYLRQHCRDLPQGMLAEDQRQLACELKYEALFDELLPLAEAGDLNALGYLIAVAFGCQLRNSIPQLDFNQELTRLHQAVQKQVGIVPTDIAAALPQQIAIQQGELERSACAEVQPQIAYILALAQTQQHGERSAAPESPWDVLGELDSAISGKRSLTAESFKELAAQLPMHMRHTFAMSIVRCKIRQCALPVSDGEANQWLRSAIEHGDWEALTYWRGQLAQDPAHKVEAYAWNLFSRDLLRVGCYPIWFVSEAAYNFGELEQVGQHLSTTAQAEAQQLANDLIAQFGQQARQNLACD